jgi:hypothetical protein
MMAKDLSGDIEFLTAVMPVKTLVLQPLLMILIKTVNSKAPNY